MSRRRGHIGYLAVTSLAVALAGACGGASGDATYDVTAESATIAPRDDKGACWEPACGAPKSYVCATLSGLRRCSTSRASTMPQWFELLLPSAATTALRTGLTVEYMHGSGAPGDAPICRSNVVLTALILGAGHFDLPCGGDIVVTLGLKAN